jgi:hypothetical protein
MIVTPSQSVAIRGIIKQRAGSLDDIVIESMLRDITATLVQPNDASSATTESFVGIMNQLEEKRREVTLSDSSRKLALGTLKSIRP